MIDLIEQRRPELTDLCRRYRVKTLEVFGSASNGNWDPATSDLDFRLIFFRWVRGNSSITFLT